MNVTEIKSTIKISDLPQIRRRLKAYVSGKKRYCMNCPFHPDKNSSAGIVTHQKGHQIFNCFACKITEDVIGVYGRLHNLHYMDAAKQLSEDNPSSDLQNKIKQTIHLRKYFKVSFYHGFEKLISENKRKAAKDGTIPLALRYISLKVLDRVSLSTVQRELSTLFCLGLLVKPPAGKGMKARSRFALVPLTSVTLNEAEKRAQRLKENGVVKKFIKDSDWIKALPKAKALSPKLPEEREIDNIFEDELIPVPEKLTREAVLKLIAGKDRKDPYVIDLLKRFQLQLKMEQESFKLIHMGND